MRTRWVGSLWSSKPRLLFGVLTLGAVLMVASTGTASPGGGGMATGAVSYEGFVGTESIALVAHGTPAAASGWMHFKRDDVLGFGANSEGPVTCYLEIGNRGYFAGAFKRTFFSGPTEIRFFNGIVVDGNQAGGLDSAFVELGADAPIPCNDPGTMAFLDAVSAPAVSGNIVIQ